LREFPGSEEVVLVKNVAFIYFLVMLRPRADPCNTFFVGVNLACPIVMACDVFRPVS
jgi:hypothetical protein